VGGRVGTNRYWKVCEGPRYQRCVGGGVEGAWVEVWVGGGSVTQVLVAEEGRASGRMSRVGRLRGGWREGCARGGGGVFSMTGMESLPGKATCGAGMLSLLRAPRRAGQLTPPRYKVLCWKCFFTPSTLLFRGRARLHFCMAGTHQPIPSAPNRRPAKASITESLAFHGCLISSLR